MSLLMYGSETMIGKEESSGIRNVQMDNLRGLLDIRGGDKVQNARIRELCGITKGLVKVLSRWFAHDERTENDRIAKGVCEGVQVVVQ